MRRADLLAFIRSHKYAVQASVSRDVAPQAAVVGIAVSDTFEIVFDTLESSRKAFNLGTNTRIAFVIAGTADGDERTVQYEGIAARPSGAARDAALELYFSVFPDGRDRLSWKGITHFHVTPTWLRYSNFNANPPEIVELSGEALRALRQITLLQGTLDLLIQSCYGALRFDEIVEAARVQKACHNASGFSDAA